LSSSTWNAWNVVINRYRCCFSVVSRALFHSTTMTTTYDAQAREDRLRQEAESWDVRTSQQTATLRDIPILDVTDFLQHDGNDDAHKKSLAEQLGIACETVGFFALVGHGIDVSLQKRLMKVMKEFFDQDEDVKRDLLMDRPECSLKGVGYLPLYNRKLPTRSDPNANESYIVKRAHDISWDDNPWPTSSSSKEFRKTVQEYGQAMEDLARRLLPLFAIALDVREDFFEEAFREPFYRLRLTHYPPNHGGKLGILPHVDTSFLTILAQSQEGLVIFDERCGDWTRVPVVNDALVVNVGELLRQWTNDRFKSVKHYAANDSTTGTEASPRYSAPFFFNANADYVMTCIPTCCDEENNNPPKYPPVSYRSSQAAVQGE